MASDKVVETAIVGNYIEMETEGKPENFKTRLSKFFWHGGSAYDAWFSCSSNQVAQVLLTLPYSFSQLGMMSGILFQILYGLLGSWTAYLISILYVEYRTRKEREKVDFRNHVIQWFEVLDGLLGKHWRNVGLAFNCTFLLFGSVIQLIACASNIYYINDNLDKRTWTYIFGACCATSVFIPSFHNYRIWSFVGLIMTTYTAWYLTIASLLHGQVEGAMHSGPTKLVLYFTGATNILYTFGGHAVTVEIMHAMWKPRKFKAIYLLATLYVMTLTLPSAAAVYWAFGDMLLNHSNAFALLPRSPFRDMAVVLMLIHQFITFGFASTPLYFVWEKAIGMHECKSVQASSSKAAGGHPHMVFGHSLPLLWTHQLHRWLAPRQLHRLYHPGPCSHVHLQIRYGPRERGGATTEVPGKMGGSILDQCVCGGVGACGWIWVRWVGQRGQLHPPNRHLWTLHQVLSMPSASSLTSTSIPPLQLHYSSTSSPPPQPMILSFVPPPLLGLSFFTHPVNKAKPERSKE